MVPSGTRLVRQEHCVVPVCFRQCAGLVPAEAALYRQLPRGLECVIHKEAVGVVIHSRSAEESRCELRVGWNSEQCRCQ